MLHQTLPLLPCIALLSSMLAILDAKVHVIGWQTFENKTSDNNNSGIHDNTPDTNSTYDASPAGTHSNLAYLSGSIGADASYNGHSGYGQATNNDFLNNGDFGSDLRIVDYSLANGATGQRIGPYGNPNPNGAVNNGTSSWKFSQQNSTNGLFGDFSITNHSDYHFRLETIHFDARGLPNPETSPNKLELRYLASSGELIQVATQSEVSDQKILYSNTWSSTGVEHVSQDIASVLNSTGHIPPGQSASFRFAWSGTNGNGHAQIDNLALSGTFLDANDNYSAVDPVTLNTPPLDSPNIIVIIADDHRWDATSYMQERMAPQGRFARFPWLASPTARTPNIDQLSTEGIHFDNAFSVYSICSPARATMLTGQHGHIHGITNNTTDFPSEAVTYASLLSDAGYATGYFGKWHMGTQAERPGFNQAVTYHGQGTYFSTDFYDQEGAFLFTSAASDWVDDVSTQHALNFINAQTNSGNPFMLVLGFKTPHSPRQPPNRSANLFDSDTPISVPNLSIRSTFAPNANAGTGLTDLRNYMRTVVGIDQNVGQVLSLLDSLNIADNTAVIYISDQGYFRGEHGLGDKRAAYEESIRIPFMIRYPALQSGAANVSDLALNLDLAPTILDIAGLEIPNSMQGKSLLPFIGGQSPEQWRDSFLYSYCHDPEFPTASVRPYIAVRHADGSKLVIYAENSSWNELYQTDPAHDPYETSNRYTSAAHRAIRDSMESTLSQKVADLGFLKIIDHDQHSLTIQGGDSSHFKLQSSTDLSTWSELGMIEGNGENTTLSLISSESNSSESIIGLTADYTLLEGPPIATNQSQQTLRSGSISTAGGRNAVLVFELPALASNRQLSKVQLEVSVKRQYAQWDSDLWSLGIKSNTNSILEYSENPSGDPAVVKLQDAFLTDLLEYNIVTRVSSSPICGLTQHIQNFYQANPNYSGGQYLFLRINPSYDIGVNNQAYLISSANHDVSSQRPVLKFFYQENSEPESAAFYRVRYGNESP